MVEIVPLDVEVITALAELPVTSDGDPTDRLIVATARAHRRSLATQDRAIRRARLVKLWKAR